MLTKHVQTSLEYFQNFSKICWRVKICSVVLRPGSSLRFKYLTAYFFKPLATHFSKESKETDSCQSRLLFSRESSGVPVFNHKLMARLLFTHGFQVFHRSAQRCPHSPPQIHRGASWELQLWLTDENDCCNIFEQTSLPKVRARSKVIRMAPDVQWFWLFLRILFYGNCSGVARGGIRGPWTPGGTFWGAALCW